MSFAARPAFPASAAHVFHGYTAADTAGTGGADDPPGVREHGGKLPAPRHPLVVTLPAIS